MADKLSIYEKLSLIQNSLKVPKNNYNSFGKYNYRSCEDIVEAVKPLAKKHNVLLTLTDGIAYLGDRYYVEATAKLIDLESDNVITVTGYAREEENKKGMDGSQVTGAASSYARKYALNGMFAIDDTKDSDATNTHGNEQDKPKPTQSTTPSQGLTEAQIKRFYAIAKKSGYESEEIKGRVEKKYKKKLSDFSKKEYDEAINIIEMHPKKESVDK